MSRIFGIFAFRNALPLCAASLGLLVHSLCIAQCCDTKFFNTVSYAAPRPCASVDSIPLPMDEEEDVMEEDDMISLPSDSVKAHLPLAALPLKSVFVTSPFGMRIDPMKRQRRQMHCGIDLRARHEPVFSMLAGKVVKAANSLNGGLCVTIDHGACTCSYLHLSKILVKVGQLVKAGQQIAVSGNTGKRTTGPHLHVSCKWSGANGKHFDPMLILGLADEQTICDK